MIHKTKMQRIQRGRRFSPDSFLMRQPQCGLLSLRRLEIAAEYKHVFFSTGSPDIFRCAFGAVLLLSLFFEEKIVNKPHYDAMFQLKPGREFFATGEKVLSAL